MHGQASLLTLVSDLANYTPNLYAIPTLLTSAAVLALGLTVLFRERIQMVSVSFFLMTLAITIWLFAFSLMYCAADPRVALWWAKAAYLGVPCIPASIYHFTVSVLGTFDRHKRLVWMSWFLAALFMAAILCTDWLIVGLYRYWWGYYPRYGWLSVPYLTFFFSMTLVTLGQYWIAYRRAAPGTIHQRRILSLLIAFHLVYGGSVDYLAKFGIPFYPFGYASVLAFLCLVAWAIQRYRLVGFSPAFAAKEILKAMGNALIVLDGAGMIQIVNRVACELFRKPEAHLVGSSLTELGLPGHVLAAFSTPPVDGQVRDLEFALQDGAHGVRNLSATAFVMRDQAGQSIGTVWILADITERKLSEEQLQDAHAALKHSHAELQATQLQLIQAAKLESVGRLAAGVAHEVKNPLAIISMGAEYLAKSLTNGNGHARTVLTDVQGAVRRADAVIRGLLDFAAAHTLQMRRESVKAAIEPALLLVKHELERVRVEVVNELADGLPSCPLDRVRIEQVFVNLFMNAIQAMPTGGRLTVRSRVRRLAEVGRRVGQRATDRFRIGETVVEVEVEDTGSGIAVEHLEKVFDPFFTTKPTGQGTGLGLAVTRSIIELHRGDIRVENHPAGGVRVTILFKTEGGDGDGQAADQDHADAVWQAHPHD